MLKFTKGIVNQNQTKIATEYIRMSDMDRIQKILECQKQSKYVEKKEEKKQNIDFQTKINALKNIKKD